MTASNNHYPSLAIRSSTGIEIYGSIGLKEPFSPSSFFAKDESKNSRAYQFSNDGKYFAWANGTNVQLATCSNWKIFCTLPRSRAFYVKFSPRATYIMTWEMFTVNKDSGEGNPNLYVYKTETGDEVFKIIQKKQTDWEPGFSNDETIFGLMVGGEAVFYDLNEDSGFDRSSRKIGGLKNGLLSIGPGASPPLLAVYIPGAQNSPSMCKMFKYPTIQSNQAIACKSLFQVDRCELLWNKRGTGVLLLTSTEVDKTGASYYGKQALNFMSAKGDSFVVQLGKEGPIHSVAWSPKHNEFCVVYGYMPAKATLFNLKCDVVHHFEEASRNCCYYNEFGNLLILAGFGNLRGYVEVWNTEKRKLVSSLQAPDSTFLEWSPTGETFVTATTAPRLRIGNGFKVWHYTGALLHETLWPEGQELLEVLWQKYPEGFFKENPITNTKIEGIKSSQPEPSKQVYQPPNIRLQKDGNLDQIPQIPGLPPGYTGQRKNSHQNQRQTRNQRNKRDSQSGLDVEPKFNVSNGQVAGSPIKDNKVLEQQKNKQRVRRNFRKNQGDEGGENVPQDPEKEKKIRAVNKKLQDISKLKSKQSQGEHLEANQISKITSEASLLEELRALKI